MHQFLRVETYARQPKEGQNVYGVVAEAERKPSHCSHVKYPEAPKILYGTSPTHALDKAENWASAQKDSLGRKIRKDGMILLAGVISYPRHGKDWEDFKADSVVWLKEKYGENLECIVEHVDEEHPHIHFYAVPKIGQHFNILHEGRAASEKIKKNKGTKKQQELGFSEKMRLYQDHFYSSVSRKYALARLGPKRQRLTRSEWKSQQTALKVLAASSKQRYSLERAELDIISSKLLEMGKKDLLSNSRTYRKEDIDKIIKYVESEVQKGQSHMQVDAVKTVTDAIANSAELQKENEELNATIIDMENDFKKKEMRLTSHYNQENIGIINSSEVERRELSLTVRDLKLTIEGLNSKVSTLTKNNETLSDLNNELDEQLRERNRHAHP